MTSSIEHGASEATELEALLARIAQGEKDALASLYERTHSAVYGFAMSLSHCPADAEDVLQETYINVYSAAERYVPKGKPMAWIMTIAKNLAKMRLREVKKTVSFPKRTGPATWPTIPRSARTRGYYCKRLWKSCRLSRSRSSCCTQSPV